MSIGLYPVSDEDQHHFCVGCRKAPPAWTLRLPGLAVSLCSGCLVVVAVEIHQALVLGNPSPHGE